MSTKKPHKSSKKPNGKVSPSRDQSAAEIKKIRADIAGSERRTQNRIQFIIEHQAKFSADIDKLNQTVGRLANLTLARVEESNAKHRDTDAKIAALVDAQIQTEENSKRTDEKIAALVDAQIQTEENSKRTDEKIAALVDAQLQTEEAAKKTDEKIATLVDAQLQTEEAAKKTDEKIATLAAAQLETGETVKKTSEAVRSLTAIVDRYLKERRNGK